MSGMFYTALVILCTISLVGCAHRPKGKVRSIERAAYSKALLAATNAALGSFYTTKIYVIDKGDSLSKIAAKFNTTANELRRLNPMIHPNGLYIGYRLRVEETEKTSLQDPEFFSNGLSKSYAADYKHVILVCVTSCYWEDKGANQYSLHHFKGIVAKVLKGDWKVSEEIDFVHGVDSRGTGERNGSKGDLLFIFTNEHTDMKFGLEAGEFLSHDAEFERELQEILSSLKS